MTRNLLVLVLAVVSAVTFGRVKPQLPSNLDGSSDRAAPVAQRTISSGRTACTATGSRTRHTAGCQPAQTPPAQQTGSQAAEPPVDASAPIIRLGVNEVNLIFTVTDKHGHYIPNLQQSDFALLDDQKAPARVNSFHQQINLPLRVGIVIDASTSIRSRFQFEQQSATEFLLAGAQGQERPRLRDGLRCDAHRDAGLDQQSGRAGDRRQPAASRRRHGAVRCGLHCLPRQAAGCSRGQEPVRKAMVLISDGDDNQSRVHPDEAIKECERAETIIYAISTNWTPSRGKGDKVLHADGRGHRRPGLLPALGRRRCPPASRTLKKSCAASTR